MRWTCALIGLLLLSSPACNSIKTTPIDRQSGGQLSADCQSPLPGIPVMLRVPTHLDVEIKEVEYWTPSQGILRPLAGQTTSRHVSAEVQSIEQMFLVDPKRVASGSGAYGFQFDAKHAGHGYLSGADYQANDTTLSQTSTLIASIAKTTGSPISAAEQDLASTSGVITTTRTIAFRKFDINSPSVDQEVKQFCDQYVNGIHLNEFVSGTELSTAQGD